MRNINFRHLLAALEVNQCGSISDAADRIHLSQSAITQALAKLEAGLGTVLFSRRARGMVTTAAGEVFFSRVMRAVDWLKAIERVAGTPGVTATRKVHRLLSNAQLRALIAVVDSGSYTHAAILLGLSQPTVHRAVRELEELCQQKLFQRSPQGVVPTWQAKQIARHGGLFFAEIAQGMDEINELSGVMTGRLVVGALPLSRTRLVPQAVTGLLKEYPGAKVRIVDGPYTEQLNALLHGRIDVIVGAIRSPSPSGEITQEFLFRDALSVVVRPHHKLIGQRHFSPQKLRQLDWIAPTENTPAREVFNSLFKRAGLEPPDHVIECSSLAATRELLLASDRAALLSAKQVEVDVKAGLLAVSCEPLAGTERDIGLTLRKDWRPTKTQARFLALVRSYSE
jgi:LysR family transcriptional regulator of gallate degradation